jgi:hypothetical protein
MAKYTPPYIQVPLNSFKTVIAKLTGGYDNLYNAPAGVSTILLSAQVTNDNAVNTNTVTIFVTSNREVPIPQIQGLPTGSFPSASALLRLNEQFMRKEVAAYVKYQNLISQNPFAFTSSIYELNTLRDIQAVATDVQTGGTLEVYKSAISYYDKDGNPKAYSELEVTASYNAAQYANVLAQQIILNQSVTASANVDRLYQTVVTQSINPTYTAESGSSQLISAFYTVIENTILSPTLDFQTPVELVKNVPIPPNDSLSPIVLGKLVLQELYGVTVSGSTDCTVILSLLESANS